MPNPGTGLSAGFRENPPKQPETAGTPIAIGCGNAGLITAGRRECWGSQASVQRGIAYRGALLFVQFRLNRAAEHAEIAEIFWGKY